MSIVFFWGGSKEDHIIKSHIIDSSDMRHSSVSDAGLQIIGRIKKTSLKMLPLQPILWKYSKDERIGICSN